MRKWMKVKFIAKGNIGNKCENKPVTNQQTSNRNQMQSANVASKLNPIKFLIEMLQFLAADSVVVGVLVLLSSNNGGEGNEN